MGILFRFSGGTILFPNPGNSEKMYTLTLDEQDRETISFVGHRYCWSEKLSRMSYFGDEKENGFVVFSFPENIAWEIKEAFENDTEGGHSFFPMLDHRSDLARKLFAFMDSIV